MISKNKSDSLRVLGCEKLLKPLQRRPNSFHLKKLMLTYFLIQWMITLVKTTLS